ncbi:MAG: MlaD/PqiB family protein, partial [Caulobacteraceae bacterium]
VGVTDVQTLHLVVFIFAPFDHLVRDGTLFFNANAANVSFSAGELNASLGPGTSVVTGGIEFDTPMEAAGQPQSAPNTTFRFFPSEARAKSQPQGTEIRYQAVFPAASELPQTDAPVFLSGQRVGRVLKASVDLPPGARATVTHVDLEIEAQKLSLSPGADRADVDTAISNLIRGGYRLTMSQNPPLIGTATLILARAPGAAKASLIGGPTPQIPTVTPAGLNDLTATSSQILDKVNAIPITEIGKDVRQLTSRLSQLIASPEVDDSLHKLDSTLTSVDQITREVKPQVGPLITKLNQAADEVGATAAAAQTLLNGDGAGQDASLPDAVRQLTEAARSIRSLADYLGRHPEAVLKGKAKDGQ